MIDAKTKEVIEKLIIQELEKVKKERELGLIDKPEEEIEEVNPAHGSDGRFAKKGQGKTYSLTRNALDNETAKNMDVPARGTITKQGKVSAKFGMNTGDPDKQCGRLDISGDKKKKTRSCKDYPKNYWNEEKEREESEYIKNKKKQTKRKNHLKNKRDSVPRSNDSPAVRREKVFPGTEDMFRLARGIAEEQAQKELPRWDSNGKLEEEERHVETDDAYLKGLIKAAVFDGIAKAREEAAKQGQRYSWNQIMKLIQDLETAQKGAPKPK